MHLRDERIAEEIQELRQQPNLEVNECQVDGLIREDFWVIWVKGKENTLWEGGFYPVEIQFPKKYPIQAPKISFPVDFKHVHVYEGGLICLPILDQQYWKPKSSMKDLVTRIISLVHQEINPYSPANNDVFQLYKTDHDKYTQMIRSQAKKYEKKIQKYFAIPCIHVDVHQK